MVSFEDVEESKEYHSILDADLVLLIAQIHTLFDQGMQQRLEHSTISSDGLWFIAAVKILGDNATPSELARRLVRKQNTISGLAKRMEEKGFVTKKRINGANNRVYLRIVLTEKGEQFLKDQSGPVLVAATFSRLTFEEKRQLRGLLLIAREAATQMASGYEEPPYPSSKMASQDYNELVNAIMNW